MKKLPFITLLALFPLAGFCQWTLPSSVVQNVDANTTNLTSHAANAANPHAVTKSQVGLSNVPNTDATSPANITQSASYRFATDAEKTAWNAKNLAAQTFKGGYNPATNTPALSTTASTQGDYYEVTTAGSTSAVSGSVVGYTVGDKIISNGSTWSRIPLVTLGVSIANGKNLFDISQIILNTVINNGSGTVGSAGGFNLSPVIPVTGGTFYTLSGLSGAHGYNMRLTNAAGTLVTLLSPSTFPYSFSTTSDITGVQFICKYNDETQPANIQLELGQSFTGYTAYIAPVTTAVNGYLLQATKLASGATLPTGKILSVGDITTVMGKNLFDVSGVISGSAVGNGAGGAIGGYAGFSLSPVISVSSSAVYTVSGLTNSEHCIRYENALGASVGFVCPTSFPYSFTTPATATAVRFTVDKPSEASVQVQLEAGSTKTSYAAYSYYASTISGYPILTPGVSTTTSISNKRVDIFGDSISDNGYAPTNWTTKGAYTGATIVSHGVSSTTFRIVSGRPTLFNSLTAFIATAAVPDVVVFSAGTNEELTNIGSLSATMVKSYSALDPTVTMYDALRWTFEKARKTWGGIPMFVATPLQRGDNYTPAGVGTSTDPLTLRPLHDAIKDVARIYNMIILDQGQELGINYYQESVTPTYLNSDKLHPNAAGQTLQGRYMWSGIVRNAY